MNRVLSILLVGAIVIGMVPYARSVGTPSPPPGVPADNWVAMGESAGFVITSASNDFHQDLKSEPNAMKGYFIVRHKDSWVRVDASDNFQLRPAKAEH
jgi:hypothetical protein